MRRVVITGYGGVTALGNDWATIKQAMKKGETAIDVVDEWRDIKDISTFLGAYVKDDSFETRYTRKQARTMGRISKMAVYASEKALDSAKLTSDALPYGRTGVAYGSSFGSKEPFEGFFEVMKNHNSSKMSPTGYLRMMGHTTAVNISLFFGLSGRVIPTSSACTSGSQGIGYAYEAIKAGYQDVMFAGGAEELTLLDVVVFDMLYATSTKNNSPKKTPSPFDGKRDGLVLGEGACTVILEDYEHAKKRGAPILAEVLGFATNSDGRHPTQPTATTMEKAMAGALESANITSDDIDYISAHGTGTVAGDLAESYATFALFGKKTPISSLKGYFGHTLGACGSLETWLTIEMMREGQFAPNMNLTTVTDCAPLDYIRDDWRPLKADKVMSNNFAFGGINTSLIFGRL